MATSDKPEPAAPAAAPAAPAAAAAPPAAPAAAQAPAPAAAPEPAAPAAAPAVKPADAAPALLAEPAKPAEAPAEAPPAEAPAEKPAETPPAEKPAEALPGAVVPPLVYEKFTVPEGVTLDEEKVAAFTGILGEAQVPQEVGQKLVDLHLAAIEKVATSMQQKQHDVFGETRKSWVETVRGDRELGGNRLETTLQQGRSVVARFGGSPTQVAELKAALTFTGAGDHPAVVRLLSNIGAALAAPQPVPASNPAPAPASKAEGRYKTTRSK